MDLWPRARWGATFDIDQRPRMALPARELWVHHTVTKPTADPAVDMRLVERIDIQRFGVPSYSWVIHPSGVVLEGTGVHRGAHTKDRNSYSFGVSLIGNYEESAPTDAALDALVELVRFILAAGWLQPGDYPTGGHRDVFATACPGRHLYPLIPLLRRRVAAPPPPPTEELPDMLFARLRTDDDRNGRLYLVGDNACIYVPDPEPQGVPVWDIGPATLGQLMRSRAFWDYGQ